MACSFSGRGASGVCAVMLASAAISALSGAARADVIVSNMAEPTRAATLLGTSAPAELWAAQAFFPDTYYVLDTIDVLLGASIGNPDVVARLTVGPTPAGPTLTTFSIAPVSTGAANAVRLVPNSLVSLRRNAAYWVIVGPASTGTLEWSYSEGNGQIGPGQMGPFTYSEDLGVTWGAQGAENPHQLEARGFPVPCPADLAAPFGTLDIFDILRFFQAFGAGELGAADLAPFEIGDGQLNIFDILEFFSLFGGAC